VIDSEWVVTLGSRNRLTLPGGLAQVLDVKPGDRLLIRWFGAARIVRMSKAPRPNQRAGRSSR